VVARKKGNERV
jgi:hypothetical protein